MASIFCGVVLSITTISIQDGVFDNLVKNVVSFYSGYLQIHKTGYWEEQILDNGMRLSPTLEDSLLDIPGVLDLASRIESFALASSEELTRGCLVTGIQPERENVVTVLEDKLIAGNYLADKDDGALLSQGLAAQLQLSVGDSLILIGQGYHGAMAVGKYPVRGVLKFGSPQLNDQAVFLSLPAAQAFFGADGIITTYVLSVSSPNRLPAIAARLKAGISNQYEVMTWEEILPDISQHIQTDKSTIYIIIGVLYLLVVFGIFGTQLMMMVERKFEMSMLIAIGMSKIRLIKSMLMESVLTVFIGCLAGILLSIPLVFYLNRFPIRFSGETAQAYEQFGFEAVFPTSTEAVHFWSQGLIVLIIGLILSIYPVIRILRMDPVEAIRNR